MQETWVCSLGREDPLEEEMATHSSVLAWEILWTDLFQKTNVHRMVLSFKKCPHPGNLTGTFPGLPRRTVFTLLLMPGTAP